MKTEINNQVVAKKQRRYFNRDMIELTLLTLPTLIYLFIMNYLPMGGLVIAFKDFKYNKGIFGSEWNGFKNFEFFFTSQDAWRITRNTVGYGILFLVLGIVCAVTVALLLFEIRNRTALKVYQTIMILPNFLSWVIVGYIGYIFLNPIYGVVNNLLTFLGFDKIDWYADPKYWPYLLSIFSVWKGVGMSCIMYYAALMGIDESLFEAAKIDGANKMQMIKYISIPELASIISIMTILNMGNIFRGDFGLFYQMPRDIGTLYPTTDIIDTYIYRGLRTGSTSVTAAVGFFQSFVGLLLVVGTNMIVRKIAPENSLF